MKLLHLTLAFAAVVMAASANAQAQTKSRTKPETASPAVQKEFSAFIAKFRAALKANDAAAVAGMAKLPFAYNEEKLDAAQFRAKAYPYYFTPRNRACIQTGRSVYSRDGYKNDTYSIFCGDLIFTFTKSADGFAFSDVDMND